MAVAGGGKPSRPVWVRNRTLCTSYAQNTDSMVIMSHEDAAAVLCSADDGTMVRVDAAQPDSLPALWRALRDAGRVDGVEGIG